MTFSVAKYRENFEPVLNGNAVEKLMTYVTGAGTPTATSTVPEFIGQEYFDSAAAHFWKCCALSSPPVVGDWKIMT